MKTLLFIVFLTACFLNTFVLSLYVTAIDGLDINIDTTTGSYKILLDGDAWFSSGATAIRHKGKLYSSANGSLKLVSHSSTSNSDKLGDFKSTSISWTADDLPYITTFKVYSDSPVIVFEQNFPQGATDCANGDNNDVISSFPSLSDAHTGLFYYTYEGTFAYPSIGNWGPSVTGGVQAGPVIIYNNKLRGFVLSPFSNFMVGIQSNAKSLDGLYACGIQGKVKEIPSGFTHSTILYAGVGIYDTFYAWGSTLLKYYGKERVQNNADILIEKLGYWTDNGAYYYYLTEPGKNYAETMVDVYNYMKQENVPVTNYQFDSWWYFKGKNDGVKLWESMPSIFPDGMKPLDDKLGKLPLALHNRYFSPDNDYIGMGYSFAVEDYCALPLTESLFTYIMAKAKTWGMVLYEQDWLVTTFLSMNATQDNVQNARNWLINMGSAASKLDVTIQYCMPLPNHLLQSVEIPAVTQSRASGDYNPGNPNWKIGHSSLLINSLGIKPFKDDFWTTSNQPGCKFRSCVEPNPELISSVASLSSGPVGPSDKIGSMNSTIVGMSCRHDGLLLKPDRPLTPLELTFLPTSWSPDKPQVIELWSTFSAQTIFEGSIAAGIEKFYYVIGAELQSGIDVYPADLGLSAGTYIATDYWTKEMVRFDSGNPLKFPKQTSSGGKIDFKLYVVSNKVVTTSPSSWALFGEVDKFATVSSQRFSRISYTSADHSSITVKVLGVHYERINVGLYNVTSNSTALYVVPCVIGSTGVATVTCSKTCSCA